MYQEFKRIALRENKHVTELIKEQMKEYIKAHGEGNPNLKLDGFPDMKGYPTPWDQRHFSSMDFSGYSDEELADMTVRLRNGLTVINDWRKANTK